MFNRKSFTLITAPAVEPVLLSDVKHMCRVDGTADDALLTSLIVAARAMCEEYTKCAFITQTWKMTLDRLREYCEPVFEGVRDGPSPRAMFEGEYIQLSRQPVQSVSSITAYDVENEPIEVDVGVYLLDEASGRVILNQGQVWPDNLRDRAGAEIIFVAGYGDDGGDVPPAICQAIKQTVVAMYKSSGCDSLPAGAKTLLTPYMLPEAYGLV